MDLSLVGEHLVISETLTMKKKREEQIHCASTILIMHKLLILKLFKIESFKKI